MNYHFPMSVPCEHCRAHISLDADPFCYVVPHGGRYYGSRKHIALCVVCRQEDGYDIRTNYRVISDVRRVLQPTLLQLPSPASSGAAATAGSVVDEYLQSPERKASAITPPTSATSEEASEEPIYKETSRFLVADSGKDNMEEVICVD